MEKLRTRRPHDFEGWYNPWEYISSTTMEPHKKKVRKVNAWTKHRPWLRRSYHSFCLILIWYLVFYLALAALYSICWYVYIYLIHSNEHPATTDLLTTMTGRGEQTRNMAIYPNGTKKNEKNIRYFKGTQKGNEKLKELFEEYKTGGTDTCKFGQDTNNKACKFDLSNLGPCTKIGSTPCFFIKLNRIHGWEPIPYQPDDRPPALMPAYIVKYLESLPKDSPKVNMTWLSCQVKHKEDTHLIKSFTYFPIFGFPNYYFPYLNQEGYHNPLVAVKLDGLDMNQDVKIVCRIFAKNIDIDEKNEFGSYWFEYSIRKYSEKENKAQTTSRNISLVLIFFSLLLLLN